MTADDDLNNMPWFHQLTMDERVQLLGHPHAQLPAELAERLRERPGVMEWWFADPEGIKLLAPQVASKLDDYRAQLDYWWSCLSDADKQYFIAQRDNELPGEYAHTVMSAGGAHHTGAHVLAIARVQDTRYTALSPAGDGARVRRDEGTRGRVDCRLAECCAPALQCNDR